MKKFLSLTLIFMVCLTSAIALSGCKEKKEDERKGKIEFSNVRTITLSQEEAQNQNLCNLIANDSLKQIIITVYNADNEVVLNMMSIFDAIENHDAKISGFNISTPGTRTAEVVVLGETGSFEYTVVVN